MPDEERQNHNDPHEEQSAAWRRGDQPQQDADVPFHLPKSEELEDDDYAGPDEDTDAMPAYTAPNETILDDVPRRDAHNMPTMPIPREPGMPDPKKTVVSGGNVPRADKTVQSAPVRPEDYSYSNAQQTVQSPVPADARYQRPRQAAPPPPPQANYAPAPPSNSAPPPQGQGHAAGTPGDSKKAKAPKRRGKRRQVGCLPNGCLLIFGGIVLSFCGGLTVISLVLLGIAQARLTPIIESGIASIDEYEAFQSTFYYDRNGTLLYEDFNEGRREFVPLARIPQDLVDATIALEDDTFYSNPGIDVPATVRATLQFFGLMEGSTGGSTITQQLVRNVAFDYEYRTERSVRRKAEEIILALAITQRLNKEEVLEMYLNEVYYGNLAYGAQAASNTIFGKDVGELTLGEAALLAGLPQAPAELDPLNPDPVVQDAVLRRWRTVLNAMVNEGYITRDEMNNTLAAGLEVYTPDAPLRAPHFTVFAQDELEDVLATVGISPESVAAGGYKVYTTVDLALNDDVERSIQNQVGRLAANNVSNGAVVVLKPLTGEIVAMVGSADYNNDAIDGRVNVATAPRQPGSTVKSFTYAAAIENGFSPADVIWDTPVKSIPVPGQTTWPVNYDRTYHGPVNMRAGLANSYNVPAVKVLQRAVGVEGLLTFFNRFGIESLGNDASLYGPSLTLGGGEVTLLELSRGYGVFANQGVLVPTTSILCVVDDQDNIIYQYEGTCPAGNITPQTVARNGLGQQVLDPRISFTITDMLADNNARSPAMGSNSPLRTDGIASSVKTGTTNDVKDNWTVGYTRNVVVGVWVGNSNGDPMVNSSGLTGAAPIWNEVIRTVYDKPRYFNMLAVAGTHQPDQPNPPQGMSLRQVCDVRRITDGMTDCPTVSEWLLDGPAGVPNENGDFVYRDPQQQRDPQPQAGQPFQQEISPGVVRVRAHPIPESVAAGLTFSGSAGSAVPPPPRYCQVPYDLVESAPAARDLLFLNPPPEPVDAVEAERYAQGRNIAFLPTIACSVELLNAQGSSGPVVLTAVITQPTPGQVVTEGISILGTVQFSPEQADYYKLEILGGQFGGWTTIGSTHSESVVNGELEFLPGKPGLQPGEYQLRLAVVGNGNYVQEPYTVPFTVP